MLELTKQEKRVIIFLMATALLGTGMLCYKALRGRPRVEIQAGERGLAAEIAAFKIIDINKASKDELARLKGIGPSLAEQIIKYREANGRFNDTEELKEVKGIGQAKYDSIKDNIKVE
ncbi:MAG: helix-hairpin-helix domain-containing protein [Candidatus Omnitrophica bacterium]|nr:helix-hairpin-helix domain-containing protein [Candidatus Omnitrophota bacterium]